MRKGFCAAIRKRSSLSPSELELLLHFFVSVCIFSFSFTISYSANLLEITLLPLLLVVGVLSVYYYKLDDFICAWIDLVSFKVLSLKTKVWIDHWYAYCASHFECVSLCIELNIFLSQMYNTFIYCCSLLLDVFVDTNQALKSFCTFLLAPYKG